MKIRKSKAANTPDQGQRTVTIDIPILPCEVGVAKFTVGDEQYGVLMPSNVLNSGTYTLDRKQVAALWRALRELEKQMPVGGPKGLQVVEHDLELPPGT